MSQVFKHICDTPSIKVHAALISVLCVKSLPNDSVLCSFFQSPKYVKGRLFMKHLTSNNVSSNSKKVGIALSTVLDNDFINFIDRSKKPHQAFDKIELPFNGMIP